MSAMRLDSGQYEPPKRLAGLRLAAAAGREHIRYPIQHADLPWHVFTQPDQRFVWLAFQPRDLPITDKGADDLPPPNPADVVVGKAT